MKKNIDKKRKGILSRISTVKDAGDSVPKYPDLPTYNAPGETSYLVAETRSMENARRRQEQQGERQLAKVHALEHPDEIPQHGLDEAYENTMLEHPELKDSQRMDGVDNTVIPQLTDREARREFENEKNKQQAEKQLKLGLAFQPKFGATPRPPGG